MFLRLVLAIGLALPSTALCKAQTVVNAGYPGFSSVELEQQFSSAFAAAHPQFVVIMAGTNDALNDKKLVSPEDTRRCIESMVRRSKASNARVILVTVHEPDMARLMQRHKPEAYGNVPPLERLALVDALLRDIARETGASLVDFHELFRKAGGATTELSTDGLHLTAQGYSLLARAVRSKLPAHISTHATILCFGDSLTYGQGVRSASSPDNEQTYPSQLRALLDR